jgi:hypothetical protein
MPMTRRTTAEPSDLQPVRASTRNPKPSRKRIQSLSQPTPHQAKRSKTRRPLAISSESPPSAQSASESIELSEDNPGFEIVVETDGDEQQEQQDETQDDNAEEEEEEEERPMRFQTIWRAVCDRESLPRVCSSFHTKDSLFLFDINSWTNCSMIWNLGSSGCLACLLSQRMSAIGKRMSSFKSLAPIMISIRC